MICIMPKYIIEGNIDFYKGLLEDDNNNQDEDNNCLITNLPLSDKFVTLSCGHKFNYVPLYNDIFNHKQKFNVMESSVSSLKPGEIRCPYCRNKQQGVLPYYEEFGLKKVNGVNIYTPYVAPQWIKCQYITPNLLFNPELPETDTNCVNNKCCYYGGTVMPEDDNYGDSNAYCYNHKRVMIRKYKNDIKLKEKTAKLEAKQKATQNAKQKAKDEHENMKKQKMLANQDVEKMTGYLNDYNGCSAEYRELTFRMGIKLRNIINNVKKGVSVGDESSKCLVGFKCLDGFDEKLHLLSSQLNEISNNILKIHAGYVNDETENVVIQVLDGVTTEVKAVFCKEIIKTGKNKGNLCLKDLCAGQQFCKIHSSKK